MPKAKRYIYYKNQDNNYRQIHKTKNQIFANNLSPQFRTIFSPKETHLKNARIGLVYSAEIQTKENRANAKKQKNNE
jgi:hypothetical protein